MSQFNVYAYTDLNRKNVFVDDGDIHDTGTWASSGTYYASTRDVAQYGAGQFVALIDNTGVVPTTVPRRGQNPKWSSLVLVQSAAGTETHTADEAYALATVAISTAQSGSNLAASLAGDINQAQNDASAALAAASAVLGVANGAFEIAVAGTNTAEDAHDLALTALQTAWAGTNATQTALQVGLTALQTAWAGTTVAQAAVPLAGGTMTGNLHTPLVVLGTGTVPQSQAVNGTIFYDMRGPAYQETTVDSNLVVSVKNITAGAEICAVLVSTGAPVPVIYDSQFSWFGTQIPLMPATANKKILVALAATGNSSAKVLGATTLQL